MAIVQEELLRKHRITAEQLQAVIPVENAGERYFEVQSASEAGAYYTLRYHRVYRHLLTCNCRASVEGLSTCWHRRAVEAYQEIERLEASPQAREAQAVRLDGELAYTRRPFDLMAS